MSSRPLAKRVAIAFTAYAALGAACALLFAFGRSALSGTFTWPMPVTFGYGVAGPAGTIWSWQKCSSLGERVCRSDVALASAPRQVVTPLGPVGWHEGPPPSWAISAEQPVPPAEWPPGHLVLDYAFGWPLACASFRELQIQRPATPAEVASLGLTPGDTMVDQSLLRGTPRFAGALNRLGVSDGSWPTHLLWRGVAADAAAIGLILALPQAFFMCNRILRVMVRRRVHRCPWCGYDRTGLGDRVPCPECGGVEPLKAARASGG